MNPRPRIAFLTDKMSTGGVGRVLLNFANELSSRGVKVDLVVSKKKGPYIEILSPSVKIFEIGTTNRIGALPKLTAYLFFNRPAVMATDRLRLNFLALDAARLTRSKTKVSMTAHVPLSMRLARLKPSKRKRMEKRIRAYIPRNHSLIGVSKGVVNDMVQNLHFPSDKVHLVYNPIINKEMFEMAQEVVDHPWFKEKELPILLSAGRFYDQKDFPTLINGFEKLWKRLKCRLVILGEGEQKEEIEKLSRQKGLSEYIFMPGFVINPYKFMAQADLFVLSSKWEGFGNVLAEAMALGTPVVSTNCPYGPSEILEDGKYGPLVPVGDAGALAHAMEKVLKAPIPRELLKKGAARFTVEQSAQDFTKVLGLGLD